MTQKIIVIEQERDWKPGFPDVPVILLDDYITSPQWFRARNVQVINLCRSHKYLSVGYYCSLLAEARGHRVVPTVRTMLDLGSRLGVDLTALGLGKAKAAKPGDLSVEAGSRPAVEEVDIYFGYSDHPELEIMARKLFESFPSPLLRARIERGQQLRLVGVRPLGLHQVRKERRGFFSDAMGRYQGKRWQQRKKPRVARYDLAILHDPADPLPPSDERALRRFVKAGTRLGADVELITRKDLSRLAEYDALFIRDTTRVAHYTFRFAKKAEAEGLVVIDDPTSILRCTNKVYLAELLRANGVPAPRTLVVGRPDLDAVEAQLAYPMVLKMPEGAFSSGVFKVANREELTAVSERLFRESELILAQAYTYTPYDWRIGVLDRQPLYACQYFMTKAHWQIVKHDDRGGFTEGGFKTLPVEEAPVEVIDTALKAAGLIGDGLYGVDLKQTDEGVLVIEVNDNPSIDAGVEDKVLGDELYRRIMGELVRRIERRRTPGR